MRHVADYVPSVNYVKLLIREKINSQLQAVNVKTYTRDIIAAPRHS